MIWVLCCLGVYLLGIIVWLFVDGLFDLNYFQIGYLDEGSSFFCLCLWPLLLLVAPLFIYYIIVAAPAHCLGSRLRIKIAYIVKYRHVKFCRKKKLAYYLTSSDDIEREIARKRMGVK